VLESHHWVENLLRQLSGVKKKKKKKKRENKKDPWVKTFLEVPRANS